VLCFHRTDAHIAGISAYVCWGGGANLLCSCFLTRQTKYATEPVLEAPAKKVFFGLDAAFEGNIEKISVPVGHN
jgi:hypothetical protein